MRPIFTLTLLQAVVLSKKDETMIFDDTIDNVLEFSSFAALNNRHYSTATEFKTREKLWKKNHNKVRRMNKRSKKAKYADNYTSDLTDLEFSTMLGLQTEDFHSEARLMAAVE